MTEIGYHDDAYQSTPLEQKLAWFQNAPGLTATEPARQFMAGASSLYTDSDTKVRTTMRNLGVDWTGDAAVNAGATLQKAAEWSRGAGASSTAGGRTVEGYGESFESLRGQVHYDDPWAWGWDKTASAAASAATLNPGPFLGNLTVDYFVTAQHNRTNDAAAVTALKAHENDTRTAVGTFPSIAPAGLDIGGGAGGGIVAPPTGQPGVGALPAPVAPAAVPPASVGGVGPVPAGPVGAIPGVVSGPGVGGAGPSGGPTALPAPGGGTAAGPVPGAGGLASTGRPGAAGLPTGPIGSAGAIGPNGAAGGLGADGAGARAGLPGVPGSEPLPRTGPGGTGRGPTGGGLGGGIGDPFGTGARGGLGGEPPGFGPPGGAGRGAPSAESLLGRGVGAGAGADGGWRELASRASAENGLISRGPAAGAQFAERLAAGIPASSGAPRPAVAEGMGGTPFLGGMGAGGGGRSTEHRTEYWVRSADPFDVPLPPHGDGVIQGGAE